MKTELKYYSIPQVGFLLSLSRQSIYNLIKSGKLKVTKLDKKQRISQEDIINFLADCKKS